MHVLNDRVEGGHTVVRACVLCHGAIRLPVPARLSQRPDRCPCDRRHRRSPRVHAERRRQVLPDAAEIVGIHPCVFTLQLRAWV